MNKEQETKIIFCRNCKMRMRKHSVSYQTFSNLMNDNPDFHKHLEKREKEQLGNSEKYDLMTTFEIWDWSCNCTIKELMSIDVREQKQVEIETPNKEQETIKRNAKCEVYKGSDFLGSKGDYEAVLEDKKNKAPKYLMMVQADGREPILDDVKPCPNKATRWNEWGERIKMCESCFQEMTQYRSKL